MTPSPFLISSDTLPERTTSETRTQTPNDPLIAHGWQKTTYVGSAIILLSTLAIVGYLSRKIELVVVIGLILSMALIFLFLFI